MQDRICGTAHRYVQGHCVEEGLPCCYASRKNRAVILFVIASCIFHDESCGLAHKLLAELVCGHYRAVARQGEPNGFGKAVHRVGGEHA